MMSKLSVIHFVTLQLTKRLVLGCGAAVHNETVSEHAGNNAF
jgi:hypothetical protein